MYYTDISNGDRLNKYNDKSMIINTTKVYLIKKKKINSKYN